VTRLQIDENLHEDVADRLRSWGHDALQAHNRQMHGTSDPRLGEMCRAERRAVDDWFLTLGAHANFQLSFAAHEYWDKR
jgi:Domain of unknown function (DUF5615)